MLDPDLSRRVAHVLHRADDTVPLAQRLDLADALPGMSSEDDLPDWLRQLLADTAPPTRD